MCLRTLSNVLRDHLERKGAKIRESGWKGNAAATSCAVWQSHQPPHPRPLRTAHYRLKRSVRNDWLTYLLSPFLKLPSLGFGHHHTYFLYKRGEQSKEKETVGCDGFIARADETRTIPPAWNRGGESSCLKGKLDGSEDIDGYSPMPLRVHLPRCLGHRISLLLLLYPVRSRHCPR